MPNADTALCNPGVLGRVLYWVRAHAAPGSDITMLSREELRHIAIDLSLAETDLQSLSAGMRDNTVLMERMMRAHGLDPDRMRRAFVALLRNVERVFSHCKSTGRCRRELDAGTAVKRYHEYCPNAATFGDLIGYYRNQ